MLCCLITRDKGPSASSSSIELETNMPTYQGKCVLLSLGKAFVQLLLQAPASSAQEWGRSHKVWPKWTGFSCSLRGKAIRVSPSRRRCSRGTIHQIWSHRDAQPTSRAKRKKEYLPVCWTCRLFPKACLIWSRLPSPIVCWWAKCWHSKNYGKWLQAIFSLGVLTFKSRCIIRFSCMALRPRAI